MTRFSYQINFLVLKFRHVTEIATLTDQGSILNKILDFECVYVRACVRVSFFL